MGEVTYQHHEVSSDRGRDSPTDTTSIRTDRLLNGIFSIDVYPFTYTQGSRGKMDEQIGQADCISRLLFADVFTFPNLYQDGGLYYMVLYVSLQVSVLSKDAIFEFAHVSV